MESCCMYDVTEVFFMRSMRLRAFCVVCLLDEEAASCLAGSYNTHFLVLAQCLLQPIKWVVFTYIDHAKCALLH